MTTDGGRRQRLAGTRIVVVEDDLLQVRMLTRVLERFGCEVVATGGTVASALAAVRDARFDVALLDVDLGGETSAPVAEAITAAGVPFAFLTGYAHPDLPEALARAPRIDKPVEPAELEATLAWLLGR